VTQQAAALSKLDQDSLTRCIVDSCLDV